MQCDAAWCSFGEVECDTTRADVTTVGILPLPSSVCYVQTWRRVRAGQAMLVRGVFGQRDVM